MTPKFTFPLKSLPSSNHANSTQTGSIKALSSGRFINNFNINISFIQMYTYSRVVRTHDQFGLVLSGVLVNAFKNESKWVKSHKTYENSYSTSRQNIRACAKDKEFVPLLPSLPFHIPMPLSPSEDDLTIYQIWKLFSIYFYVFFVISFPSSFFHPLSAEQTSPLRSSLCLYIRAYEYAGLSVFVCLLVKLFSSFFVLSLIDILLFSFLSFLQ